MGDIRLLVGIAFLLILRVAAREKPADPVASGTGPQMRLAGSALGSHGNLSSCARPRSIALSGIETC
jgi:hypothetical protein